MRIRRFLIVLAALALTAAGCGNDDSNGAETGDTGTATTGDDGNGDDATDDEAVEDASATLYLDFASTGFTPRSSSPHERGLLRGRTGLDVSIQPGQGSADALRIVAAGTAPSSASSTQERSSTAIAEGADPSLPSACCSARCLE
jgi:hypothetical protein